MPTKNPPAFRRSIFIDSSNLEEIKKWNATGTIDGVTTNQSILLKDGLNFKDFEKVIKKICLEMKRKPVSVELTDSTASLEEMISEAKRLNALAENIVVKVPLIPDTTKALEVMNSLGKLNIAVNITTMMTYEQMILAILATRHNKRSSFVSLFWARSIEDQANYRSKSGIESDVNSHPRDIVRATNDFLKEGGYENPKIIVGSIRNATQVGDAFAAGGHIVTVTPGVLNSMLFSQRALETIEQFDQDWKKLQEK